MGFVQKLATRNPRVYKKKVKVKKSEPKIPKLTLRYILNPKNWK